MVTLHSVTVPPVRVATTARLVLDGTGEPASVRVGGDGVVEDGCLVVARSGDAVRIEGAPVLERGRLVLTTCAPRPERTPDTIETNPLAISEAR